MTDTVSFSQPPVISPEKKRRRRRRVFWRNTILAFFILLIAGYAGICLYTWTDPRDMGSIIGQVATRFKDRMSHRPPFGGKPEVNILVLGVDNSPDGGCTRSDTMKLVHVDFVNNRISMLSIPRDTWVTLPNRKQGRINGAYQLGGNNHRVGMEMAISAVRSLVEDLTGETIQIDGDIKVQPKDFEKLVDILGGVDIDVEKRMKYKDLSQDLRIDLQPGLQRLSGYDAMCYVRFRHDELGDYGRMERQDKFLHALIKELGKPESKTKLTRNLGAVQKILHTNIRLSDLESLKYMGSLVGLDGIQTAQLPVTDETEGRAMVVKITDRAAAAQTITDILHGPRPTVVVLNGSGKNGLGLKVSESLDVKSFNILGVDTTKEPVEVSAVITSEKFRAQATDLARQIGVDSVQTAAPLPEVKRQRDKKNANGQITVVLGSDFPGAEKESQRASVR